MLRPEPRPRPVPPSKGQTQSHGVGAWPLSLGGDRHGLPAPQPPSLAGRGHQHLTGLVFCLDREQTAFPLLRVTQADSGCRSYCPRAARTDSRLPLTSHPLSPQRPSSTLLSQVHLCHAPLGILQTRQWSLGTVSPHGPRPICPYRPIQGPRGLPLPCMHTYNL